MIPAPTQTPPRTGSVIVEIRGVEKYYGSTTALGGADLTIREGSVMGLIGPNGAGKTTSMLIMSSLLARDGGSVTVGGHDPAADPAAVRRILGYMPDFFGVYEGLQAAEYLDFFGSIQGVRPDARSQVVASLLDLVGLTHKADADVNSLSRGMKQRLSLARALVHDPELLILDEPASGLDPRARFDLRELIAELSRLGKTVVISSHILAELQDICSHLAVIDEGQVLAQGSIDDIRAALLAQSRVTLRAADTDVDSADALLRGEPGVRDVRTERGVVRFSLDGDDDESARLLALDAEFERGRLRMASRTGRPRRTLPSDHQGSGMIRRRLLNPLAVRELRTRFHTTRSNWFVSIWLVSAGLIGYLIYALAGYIAENSFGFGGGGSVLASAYMGRLMFEILISLLLTGVLVIVPAIAAVSIVGERQRLTLPLLQVSQLGPFRLVSGKLVSALAYMLLLLVAVAPILAVPLLIGGVTMADVLAGLGVTLVVAVVVGAIGLWVSARAQSVPGAVGGAYLWIFVLVVGTGILAIGEVRPFQLDEREVFPPGGREVVSLWANPYIALVSAVEEPVEPTDGFNGFSLPPTPFDLGAELLILRQTGNRFLDQGFVDEPLAGDLLIEQGGFVQAPFQEPQAQGQNRGPLWVRSMIVYAVIIALALWRATRLVSVPNTPKRLIRKGTRRRIEPPAPVALPPPLPEQVPDASP